MSSRTESPVRRLLPALVPFAACAVAWVALRLADGRLRLTLTAFVADWLLVAGAALSLASVVAVLLSVRRDRAWQRRLTASVAAASRERQLLLARLDHELKNPLMAMRAAAANVSSAVRDGDATTGLRSIEEQVLRLSRLTGDLRKIADVQAGPLDRGPVDLAALVEEAVDIVREQPRAAERSIRVDLPRVPWPLPVVDGDEDLLSLAVVNLLDNAVKYTPADGEIEVRARETGGQVVLEVADTGPGIDPEDLPSIWQELYRGSRARAVPGSGLGLPLVRAVVERHGGTVSADSRVGQGTVVRVTLLVPTNETASRHAGEQR